MDINIGHGADSPIENVIDISGVTYLDKNNPANASGTLTSMSFYFEVADASSVKCGTFRVSGPNYFTCRDYENIGSVSSGSKQTFSGLNCTVSTNDLLGVIGEGSIGYYYSSGSGIYHYSGDGFSGISYYGSYSTGGLAMSGFGTAPDTGKKWQGITISKWNGITSSKINSI